MTAPNRKGSPVTNYANLLKRTAEHAGLPLSTVSYVVSAFIDVIVEEVVVNGGIMIPHLFSFSTGKNKNPGDDYNRKYNPRMGLVKKTDKYLKFKLSKNLRSLFDMHTMFCEEGDKTFITKDNWRGITHRYNNLFIRNTLGAGIVGLERVRKNHAHHTSNNQDDYVPIEEPFYLEHMRNLIDEMNEHHIFDPTYFKDTAESIKGEGRVIRIGDFTEETYPHIVKNNIVYAKDLKKLKDKGIIRAEFLADDLTYLSKEDLAHEYEKNRQKYGS